MQAPAIGDEVFWSRLDLVEYRLTCPDCSGKRFLTVTMGDDSQVTIECSLCQSGYEPSKGWVKVWQYTPNVRLSRVTCVELKRGAEEDTFEYGIDGSWRVDMTDVFLTQAEAEARAQVRAKEMGDEEMTRFHRREKDTRTWAWNVRYHRECLKTAQRDIEYHTKKLEVSKHLAKEVAA